MFDSELHEFKKQLYVINDSNLNGFIVYAPLKKACFWVDKEYGNLLNDFLSSTNGFEALKIHEDLFNRIKNIYSIPSEKPTPKDFQIHNHLILILSEICNFACSYCYAQKAHCNDVIDFTAICKAVDTIISRSEKAVRITFIGGGEPLVTYNLIKKTVEYAEHRAIHYQKKVYFSLTTNASLISKEIAKWMKHHNFRVSVSFEILPSIQNLQRPLLGGQGSYDIVETGINNLLREGIIPRFRATITPSNVMLMNQMVTHVVEKFPEVTMLHFEPVSDNSQCLDDFYLSYLSGFFGAKKIAKDNGILLTNSITTSMKQLKAIFCAGEFCVVPNGSFVSCHRVSSPNDMNYSLFRICGTETDYNIEGTIKAGQTQASLDEKCENCFARWHCAGGCAYNRLSYSTEQMSAFCNFTRELVKRTIEEQLNIGYQE